MGEYQHRFGPHNPEGTYIQHAYEERLADLGEVHLNYVVAGAEDAPPLLLIPGQTESWWGYEAAIGLLAERFKCFAVDVRGQGRSTRTPGRYTLDNMGNDLVRFIDAVIGRPCYVSGLSSGGVLSAWLSAYALPGQVIAAAYEDPPLFASQVSPAVGPGIRQAIGPLFNLWSTFLGDQWNIGDWAAMRAAAPTMLPAGLAQLIQPPEAPPQELREYDPEWGRAFWSGSVATSCDHERMLQAVKVPVMLTHHFRMVVPETGRLIGAMADVQAQAVRELITATGNPVTVHSLPEMGHSLHRQDPALFVHLLTDWVDSLGPTEH